MFGVTKELPAEILKMILQSLSLKDLSMAVLVCKRWREVGETPALWSCVTVTVYRGNQAAMEEILSSRRLQAVKKLVIYHGVLLSEEDWLLVLAHSGLKELEIYGYMGRVKPANTKTII